MICFQISIFEPLKTADLQQADLSDVLWFAFKLVSLNHWKQRIWRIWLCRRVVICFQISIFEPLKTAVWQKERESFQLWFAFKLVSLNHWKQHWNAGRRWPLVVICFQISIFEPLKTAAVQHWTHLTLLWFAFKLVSLNHWKQLEPYTPICVVGCDLLSN